MMKKAVAILLTIGILMAGLGIVNAATLGVTVNVASTLTLSLNPTSLTFDNIQPGIASSSQPLTATTTGSGSYQLQLSSTTFTTAGGSVSASALQFKETAASSYTSASATAQNMLATAGTADGDGDAKTFDFRVNFPSTASNGIYNATVTISATPI